FRFLCSATPSTLIYTLSLHDALPIYEDEHQKCDRKGDVFGPHEVRVEGRVEGKVEWNLPRGDDGERSWVDRGNHLVDIPLRRPGLVFELHHDQRLVPVSRHEGRLLAR